MVSKDFGSWEGAQQAARGGQADVIFGIYKNDARALYLDYIEPPFMMDPASIVVRKGAGFAFAQWSDLKGRKGVTNTGESYGDEFDAFMAKELTVARAAGVDKAFAALLAQEADYMIIGLFPGREEAREAGPDRQDRIPAQGARIGCDVCRLLQAIQMRRAADRILGRHQGRRSMAALRGNCRKRLTTSPGR